MTTNIVAGLIEGLCLANTDPVAEALLNSWVKPFAMVGTLIVLGFIVLCAGGNRGDR